MLSWIFNILYWQIVLLVVLLIMIIILLVVGTLMNRPTCTIRTDAPTSEELNRTAPSFLLESATSISKKLKNNQLKSIDVVEAFITQIKVANSKINAICENRFDQARSEAHEADKKLQEAISANENGDRSLLDSLPPFFGVPCTIKECFALKGMQNTSGLVTRKGIIAKEDATAVARLKAAGFIPLATTNLSELCMWYESNNKVYGQTKNPYNQKHIVGGSSGGEAAIISAAGSPCGLGSDIGGSIRMPAFFNGVFGHKPTGGLVPGTGQHPFASGAALRYLSTGPIARRAEDLWPMLQVLKGPDGKDGGCIDPPPELNPMPHPSTVDLSSLTIVEIKDDFPWFITSTSKELKEAQAKVKRHLVDLGANYKEIDLARHMKVAPDIWSSCLALAGGTTFRQYLENEGKTSLNLAAEFGKWVIGKSNHTIPALALCLVEPAPQYTPKRTARMGEACKQLKADLLKEMGSNGVLLFPSHPTTAPRHSAPLLKPFNFIHTGILNVLEMPSTQVPLGLDPHGLPLGVQIAAPHFHDHLSIAVAIELEKAFGGWVPPNKLVKC